MAVVWLRERMASCRAGSVTELLGAGPATGWRATAAIVVAGDMVGAIIVSGIGLGELVSLTLAPAELALCLFLLWTGPGAFALDRRFMRPVNSPGSARPAAQRCRRRRR